METTLTIQSLIQHFEDQLYQIDRQNLGGNVGKEPQFPQLVVYLGGSARSAHQAVSANLTQVWPQYQNELKFLSVQADGEALALMELACDGGQERSLSEDGAREIASALFGTKMHFSDRSKLLIYYILDTTSFLSEEEFLAWLPRIKQIKELLCARSTDTLDVLFLLLNENLVRQKTAAKIRNCLSGFYQKNAVYEAVSSVMLLSNRRNDNAILEDWDICYKILSAAIVLSNNADVQAVTSFFGNMVMTASYAREEKPLPQIGQVVVKGLIDELTKMTAQTEIKLLEDPLLPEKLGLTKQGTFALLDQYAEEKLYALLPMEEQLELFPRRDDRRQDSLALLPANVFNAYTMGAWSQYLSQLVGNVQEKIALDSAMRADWRRQYQSLLAETFSKEETVYLAAHLRDVEELMTQAKEPAQEAQVLPAAREQLKYMLSSDRQLIHVFLSMIQEQGRISQDFLDMWSGLLKSMRTIHTVRDNNISAFYERKVRNFFDRRGSEIRQEFARMHNPEELAPFLNNLLDLIIDSDKVFSSAFEDELESRLNEEALPADAKQYIRKKLTGNEVYVYLQTNFSLGEPVISTILLKAGTPLHNNLFNNLPPATYYYNTGNSSTAETLVVYRVSAENLVNGEEA